MELIRTPLEGPAFAAAFARRDPGALRFLHRDLADPESVPAKVAELDRRFGREERITAAGAFRAGGEGGRARIEEWVAGDGYVVTTGQQPGLFGGPLLCLYKAATAIRLAQRLEGELSRPVLPVFWVASEDHDWSEVDHCWLPDTANELKRIGLGLPEGMPEVAFGSRPLGDEVLEAIELLESLLPPTEFRDGWMEMVRDAYATGRSMAEAFADLLLAWLGDRGLVVVDAQDPVVKSASIQLLLQEVEAASGHERCLSDRVEEMAAAGWPAQVPVLEGALNLFVDTPEGRQRVVRDTAGALKLRATGTPIEEAELSARIRDWESGTVSPNALLRPVVESAIFPSIASVLGPSELAYHAQLPPLFERYGIEPAIPAPRASFAVVERKNAKVLEKLGLEIGELAAPEHELQTELARRSVPPELEGAVTDLRESIERGFAGLDPIAREVDPTLEGPLGSARTAATAAVDDAERKIVQAVKRQQTIEFEQLSKARVHLRPNDSPQERVFNPHYFLARYDRQFLDAVMEGADAHLDALPTLESHG